MATAVIVDAVRTPVGKKNGRLSGWHAVDLAAQPLAALLARNDLDPAMVEDVVYGCTMTVGEQAMNIGRNAALAAGFPDTVPGTTVDRQCGSAQQAVHFAAQAVASGAMDIVIGGGVEAMSRVPIGSTTDHGPGDAYGPTVHGRFDFIHQGLCAEEIARRWGIGREEMDRFALRSHERAARAIAEGRFEREIVPLATRRARVEDKVAVAGTDEGDPADEGPLASDEGVRADSTYDKLASLPPCFVEDGLVTAASSSQISDGAAAVLIMSEERASQLGLTPRPVPHVRRRRQRSGDHADRPDPGDHARPREVQALPRRHRPDRDQRGLRLGGAGVGEGAPPRHGQGQRQRGCHRHRPSDRGSGARLMATLLNEMERTGARYGLQTMCEGGGQANATIIERLG